MNFDITTFAGLTAAITAVVLAIKRGWPSWAAGREPRLAIAIGLSFGLAAHVAHPPLYAPGVQGWVSAVLQGLGAGIAAQVLYDKTLKPDEKPPEPPPDKPTQ